MLGLQSRIEHNKQKLAEIGIGSHTELRSAVQNTASEKLSPVSKKKAHLQWGDLDSIRNLMQVKKGGDTKFSDPKWKKALRKISAINKVRKVIKNDAKKDALSPRSLYIQSVDKVNMSPEYPSKIFSREEGLGCRDQSLEAGAMATSEIKNRKFGQFQAFGYGDTRAKLLAESLKGTDYEYLDFSKNRLKDSGGEAILSNLPRSCTGLDISFNCFGVKTTAALANRMNMGGVAGLVDLNLTSCNLNSAAAVSLLAEGFGYNMMLKRVNLSRNAMDDTIACKVIAALANNPNPILTELDLSWNKMSQACLDAIDHIKSLEFLNISWNPISGLENAGKSLGKSLAGNQTLIHLSMEWIGLVDEDVMEMAEMLKTNHTLLGIHHTFRSHQLNGKAFIVSQQSQKSSYQPKRKQIDILSHNTRGHPWFDLAGPRYSRASANCDCWICGGWQEHHFEFRICFSEQDADDKDIVITEKEYDDVKEQGIYVHFSIDGFAGEWLKHDEISAEAECEDSESPELSPLHYKFSRALPPGKHYYFFSRNCTDSDDVSVASEGGDDGKQPNGMKMFLAGDYPVEAWNKTLASRMVKITTPCYTEQHEHARHFVTLPDVVKVVEVKRRVGELKCDVALPRMLYMGEEVPAEMAVDVDDFFAPRAMISDSNSCYENVRFVHEQAAQFDMSYSKARPVIAYHFRKCDELSVTGNVEQIQQIAEDYYKHVMLIFKLGCSEYAITCQDDPDAMKKNAFSALIADMGYMDSVVSTTSNGVEVVGRALSRGELDVIFVQANWELEELQGDQNTPISKKEQKMLNKINDDNPDNAINRFEMFESLLRIALLRYPIQMSKGGGGITAAEAFRLTIVSGYESVQKHNDFIDSDDFRREVIYTDEARFVIDAFIPELRKHANKVAKLRGDDKESMPYIGYHEYIAFMRNNTNDLIPDMITMDWVRYDFDMSALLTAISRNAF